jgi:hypothetical protein
MRPTALKLLRQETVTKTEWQDLFWYVCVDLLCYTVKPVLRGHLWDKEKVGL